jgi:predicted MFS family arabinose efflux permease
MSHIGMTTDARSLDQSTSQETMGAASAQVLLLIGSGIVASAQIGKAIITVPLIRSELSLGLDLAGLVVATFATLGAIAGIGAGAVVSRLGIRRSLTGGMSAIALGNMIGAGASHQIILLAARVVEGIGFVGVVLAVPSMLARLVTRRARDFVMAAWSAYMPIGIMLMMLAAPLLSAIGWRNFCLGNAAVASACALLLALHVPSERTTNEPANRFFAEVVTVISDPSCLVLSFTFFAFACQIFSLSFALPLLLTSTHGTSLGAAGLFSALVLAVSAVGHISSGVLLRAGVPVWINIATAFACLGICSFLVYGGVLSPQGISLVAALALGIGGLAPGAIYAAAPLVAPSPSSVPSTIGLLQQASSLGQFAGPAVLGLWVESFGWPAAPEILAPAALFGLAAAFVLRRLLNAAA